MRFSIEQHYSADPSDVIDAFTDPDMYPSFTRLTRVATPVVLDRTVDGDRITMRIRMRFVAPLSAAARAVIDPERITWVQREIYDVAANAAEVVFLPDNYADRFRCSGTYVFEAAKPSGTIRRITGDLKVRMPLIGGEVERAVVSGLRDHFGQEEPLVEAWIGGAVSA